MPTHMIVIAGPKGGTGKSTTASNLLVAARMAGVDAVGVDLDPQGSLMTWSQDRAGLAVQPAVTVVPGQLPDWRDAVATAPSRVAVLDLPPGLGTQADAEALHELARAARLVVVPALPEGPSGPQVGGRRGRAETDRRRRCVPDEQGHRRPDDH